MMCSLSCLLVLALRTNVVTSAAVSQSTCRSLVPGGQCFGAKRTFSMGAHLSPAGTRLLQQSALRRRADWWPFTSPSKGAGNLGRLPGVPRTGEADKTRLYLMFGAAYPPYAYWNTTKGQPDSISGIGVDFAKEACKQCDLDCVVTVDKWENCWDNDKPGKGLMGGWYHGCVTYTNQYQRQHSLEFSHSFLKQNKPAGILARLDAKGNPAIAPSSNLSGHKICDVRAWAPTIKTLAYSKNGCDRDKIFQGYEVVVPDEDGPDASMRYLLDGKCDAIYMYADMVESRRPAACKGCRWNASLWAHLGTKYAWIHTGVMEHMPNGTTLTLSKKGSGLPALVNPCIEKTLKTKAYFEMCKKYHLVSECYPNSYFPNHTEYHPYVLDNKDRDKKCAAGQESTGIHSKCGCSSGYCGCSAQTP